MIGASHITRFVVGLTGAAICCTVTACNATTSPSPTSTASQSASTAPSDAPDQPNPTSSAPPRLPGEPSRIFPDDQENDAPDLPLGAILTDLRDPVEMTQASCLPGIAPEDQPDGGAIIVAQRTTNALVRTGKNGAVALRIAQTQDATGKDVTGGDVLAFAAPTPGKGGGGAGAANPASWTQRTPQIAPAIVPPQEDQQDQQGCAPLSLFLYTAADNKGRLTRWTLNNDELSDPLVVVDDIPVSPDRREAALHVSGGIVTLVTPKISPDAANQDGRVLQFTVAGEPAQATAGMTLSPNQVITDITVHDNIIVATEATPGSLHKVHELNGSFTILATWDNTPFPQAIDINHDSVLVAMSQEHQLWRNDVGASSATGEAVVGGDLGPLHDVIAESQKTAVVLTKDSVIRLPSS